MELKKMIIKFPKLRGERLIIAALAMILSAEAITTFWHLEKLGADEKFHLQIFLVESLESFGSFLLVVSLITTGIRAMRTNWPSFKGIAMLVIGLCLCAIPLLSVQAYKKIGNSLDDLSKPHSEKMKAMMAKNDLPLKSKIKLSKWYAQDKYLNEGVTVDYLTENGEKTRYVPTKEDIDFRNLKMNTKQTWDNNSQRLPVVTWTWIAIPVMSLLLGALTPIQKTTPNTRSDHDRA